MAIAVSVERQADGNFHVLIGGERHYYMADFDAAYLQKVLHGRMEGRDVVTAMSLAQNQIADIKKAEADALIADKAEDTSNDDSPAT